MTHIIFLVHGMGAYGAVADGQYKPDDEWFEESEAALEKIYDQFIKNHPSLGQGQSFGARFKVERLRFDSWFERYRDDWETQSEAWSAFNFTDGLVGKLAKLFKTNSADAFLWTHVVDVLLYKAGLVREAVQQDFALQFYERLKAHHISGEMSHWSVVAHSLGTAVTHATLARVFQIAENDPQAGQAMMRPTVICTAANVTRALEPPATAYADTLRPGSALGPQAYISCSHKLDPFCRPLPFAPPAASPWRSAPDFYDLSGLDEYYLAEEVIDWSSQRSDLDKLAALVPHGFHHYMMQPEVVATLWPLLLGKYPDEVSGLANAVKKANASKRNETVKAAIKDRLKEALPAQLPASLAKYLPALEKILSQLEKI